MNDKKINIILACGNNGEIGFDNKLLAKLPIDMKRFVDLTTNGTVIMGAKTAQSLRKPLKNRNNVLLSRSGFTMEGFDTISDISEAIDKYDGNIWIIGGAQIYNQVLELGLYDRIYLTLIDNSFTYADSIVDISKILNFNRNSLIESDRYVDNNYICYYQVLEKLKS